VNSPVEPGVLILSILMELVLVLIGYLGLALIALLKYLTHAVLKIIYKTTHIDVFKPIMVELKQETISTLRLALLWSVIALPLFIIVATTVLSVRFIINSILTEVQSGLLLFIEIAYLFLFIYAIILFMHYTLGKYGAIYKLPFVRSMRDKTEQLLENLDMEIVLAFGDLAYVCTIIILLIDLVYAPSPLSKGVIGAVTAYVLLMVLTNKKYDRAISLLKKFG